MEKKKMFSLDKSLSEKFGCLFLSRPQTNEFHCVLCNSRLLEMKTVIAHTTSLIHKTIVSCHSRHITPLDNNFYMCVVCDCAIPHYSDVRNHVNGKSHKIAMFRWNGDGENKNSKNVDDIDDCNDNDGTVKSTIRDIVDYNDSITTLNFSAQASRRSNGKTTDAFKSLTDSSSIGGAAYCNYSNDISEAQDSGIRTMASTMTTGTPKSSDDSAMTQDSTTTKTQNQRYADLLDVQKDIHDLRGRAREAKLGSELCFEMDSARIYCLVCRLVILKTLDNYYEHLCSLEHCDKLKKLSEASKNRRNLAEQFTKFDLNVEYMEYVSEMAIGCLVCNSQVQNIHVAIRKHMDTTLHREKWKKMRTATKNNYDMISSRLHCDWYKVLKYCCAPCSLRFDTELEFSDHLSSEDHVDRSLIYNYCAQCALLFLGRCNAYADHCKTRLHKWYVKNGLDVTIELPKSGQTFLERWGIHNENAIDYVDFVSTKQEALNETMLMDFGNRVQMIFPRAIVCSFGSISSSQCTIDVFIGCEKMNDGRTLTYDQIPYFMISVINWLGDDPQTWSLRPLSTGRSPVISADHMKTGLSCDIKFDNGLLMGGTELIKLFDDMLPSCSTLLHYLNQWLAHCGLTGSERISNYALYWYLVFYLQTVSILPSIAALTNRVETQKINGDARSNIICNSVDVDDSIDYTNANSDVRVDDLVIGFLKFYANFDFRHDVACPLVGYPVKKRSFAYLEDLPEEMSSYVNHVCHSNDPIEFSIESPMCLQDPFNLNHNLSGNVGKSVMTNFRTYCAKTADYFCSR